MDCAEAQALISEALDRAPVDADRLAEAKAHCRGCTECARFVRGLMIVKTAELPQPPEDLTSRVMDRIRAEAEADRRAAEAQAAAAAAVVEPAPSVAADAPAEAGAVEGPSGAALEAAAIETPPSDGVGPLGARGLGAARWRTNGHFSVGAWIAMAAVALVAVGVASAIGTRMMLSPVEQSRTAEVKESAGSTAYTGPAPEADTAAPPAASMQGVAPDYIVVGTLVYRLSGPVSPSEVSARNQTGSTYSDLGGGTARPHAVYAVTGRPQVYLDSTDGQVLAFDPVTRVFKGRTYQLNSGELSSYGQWPTLPSSFTTPVNDTGSPTFVTAGPDDTGVTVFVKAGGSAAEGIAIGPGAPATDAGAGNPGWTWWTPRF